MSARLLISLAVALTALGVAAPAMAGSFGPGADLASVDWGRLEQGDSPTISSVISTDGRYVVFDTRATNFYKDDDADPPGLTRRGGVFRYDIQTKALATVADGDFYDDGNTLVTRGAHNPSVSADGRYVVFSTRQRILPALDTNQNTDVYVRDMDGPKSSLSSYTLVSAHDGNTSGAVYSQASDSGSDVYPGRAISADGKRVVFRTTQTSDLPNSGSANVPDGQAFMRDLTAHTTFLLTRDTGTSTPAGGAQGPVVISGDGTTAAWVGQYAPEQTRFLSGESQSTAVSFYLWRRVADGPSAPTRRITGLADPDDTACDGSPVGFDPSVTGPCYGPLTTTEQGGTNIANRAPALSEDGYKVAFLSAGGMRPTETYNNNLDVFTTSMAPGATRKSSTVELTRDSISNDPKSSSQIESVAMSPNGRYLVLTTARVQFLSSALAPTGPAFRAQSEFNELYVVDSNAHSIERAVRASGGGDSSGEVALNASISGDGNTVSFISSAGNLFFGDANDANDAFFIKRGVGTDNVAAPPLAAPQFVTQTDDDDDSPLKAAAKRLKDGRLQISAVLPGPGKLTVFARTKGSNSRTVARASKSAGASGAVKANLALKGRDKTRVRKGKAISVSVRFRFVPDPSGAALTELIDARFAKAKAAKKK